MTLSLTLIALVAAGALGGIYMLTKEPIEKTNEANKLKAKTDVLPQFADITFAEPLAVEQDGYEMIVNRAFNAQGEPVGAAVETSDKNGFNGLIRLMIGFDNDGVIQGYSVLEQAETPGLGANMVSWFKTDKNRQSVIGFNPAENKLEVSKDGGDVDAITAATISSRAFLRAVARAYNAFSQESKVDVTSGATAVVVDTVVVDTVVVDTMPKPVVRKPRLVKPADTIVQTVPDTNPVVKIDTATAPKSQDTTTASKSEDTATAHVAEKAVEVEQQTEQQVNEVEAAVEQSAEAIEQVVETVAEEVENNRESRREKRRREREERNKK